MGCHALVSNVRTSYNYVPSLGAGIAFCILFGIALAGHIVQTIRFRRWTSILLAVGALCELLGWAGRTWNAKCPYNHQGFLLQITTLIIAPTFFTAALYIMLGALISTVGPKSSLISARAYALIFCTCDIVSLILQAVGGALASDASGRYMGNTKPGTNIMVAGIAFQLGTMTFFALFVVDFARRTRNMQLEKNAGTVAAQVMNADLKKVWVALMVSFVMIYIRSIYRTIELAQGWRGFLITHEGYFIGLDAAIMVVAVGIFLVYDPAELIPRKRKRTVGGADEMAIDGEAGAMEK